MFPVFFFFFGEFWLQKSNNTSHKFLKVKLQILGYRIDTSD